MSVNYGTLALLLLVVVAQALLPIWFFLRHAVWLTAEKLVGRHAEKRWVVYGYPWLFLLFFSLSVGVVMQVANHTATPTAPLVFYCYCLIVTMYGGFELMADVSVQPRYLWRRQRHEARFTVGGQVRQAGFVRLLTGLGLLAGAFVYWSI